ncbi:MAG: hypothetical protein WBE58_22285, partial [Verrucomicrobiales bacterium]
GNIDVRAGVNAAGTITNTSADVYFAAGGPGTSEWNDIRSYAQLGHGGYNASAGELGRVGEIITVVAGRDVIAQGGLGTGNYVLIGHGGSFSDRNAANLDSPVGVDVVRGEIQISAGRDVKVLAGDYPEDPALGQGIKSSYTWVGTDSNAQSRGLDWAANLGSGADFTLQFSRIVPDSVRMEIRLDDGLLVGELVQVGNDIKVNGAFSVDVNGDGNLENFSDGEVVGSYNPSSRVVTFTRDVNPGDDAGAPNIRLFFEHADANRAFAQIGHGGNDSDYLNGDATSPFADDKIVINALGSVVLSGGAGTGNYSMIGHGGQSTAGVKKGDILITNGGDTMLSGGTGNDSFVMIGHGGRDSTGSNIGDIKVTSGGKVSVIGGQGVQSAGRDEQFAQIGHGGENSRGDHIGDIAVNAVGDIVFTAGTSVRSSAYLGHGGWDADSPNDENPSGVGNIGDIFVKTTTGDILFTAGQVVGVSESWTQLGHGGRSNEGNHSGAITVEASLGKISFEAGTGDNNYAQLGHGGRLARGNHSGDISVTAGSDIEFRGGLSTTGSVMYAQLGHGGDDAQARTVVGNTGDISVTSGGDIIFQSGNRDRAWTQLGHGGITVAGTHTGDIAVHAAGMIAFGAGNGAGNWKYSQIGHGGGNASGGAHTGDICVVAGETILLDSSGATGSRSYSMIGHGGYGATGNQTGDINVLSGLSGANGGITLLGAVSTEANDKFTQIGHGGGTSNGNKTGDIAVTVLHGDLTLTGGTAQYSGALIGHGDSTIGTNGTRTGAMDIYVDGSTVVTDGAPGNSHAYLWHQTTSGIGSVSGDHFSLVTRDLTLPASQLAHLTNFNTSSYLSKMITNGLNLVIGDADGSGGIDINFTAANLAYNTAADTNIITSGNVNLARNIQTTGGGNVNLIAGWDGTAGFPTMDVTVSCDPVIGVFDFAAAVAGGAVGAAGSETVTIGDGTQTSGIAVGSATGLTGVAGYSVVLHGSNSTAGGFAQIGYRPTVAAETVSGSLHVVSADGSVVLLSGSAANAPAQIGHGGTGTAATNLTGDICVHAGTTVTLDADNGGGSGSFSQIGHGGGGVAGNHSGEITVVSGVSGTGGVTLTGGALGTNRYAQIGHGGVNATGDLGGEIFVVADQDGHLTLTGGAGTNAYAMVGHGDGAGTAGGTRQGGIHYFAGGDATISDGAGTGSQAYLLHHTSNAGGLAGAGNYLGGNGFQYAVNGTTTAPNTAFEGISPVLVSGIGLGDVSVAINGNVDLTIEGPSVQTNNGYDFTILTGGDLRMNLGYQNLGNGDVTLVAGWSGGGPLLGTVDLSVVCDPVITPGALNGVLSDLCAISGTNSGMLYIGNASQTQGVAVGSRQGNNNAAGYGMVIEASDTTANAFSQFGFRPTAGGQGAAGTILVHLKQGGLSLNSGNSAGAYTQIGHGGLDAIANGHGADITIEFCDAGDVTFNGGAGAASYAQIGHIGYRTLTGNTATATGNITVTGFRNFDLNAGDGTAAYVQVGHGGYEGDANKTGDITLTGATAPADQGLVTLDGSASGASSDSYAQIGHGGRNSSNTKTGNIAISNVTDIDLTGGSGTRSFAQIGHGGSNSQNAVVGTVNVSGSGDLTVKGGTGSEAAAHLGHGGQSVALSVANQKVTVDMGGAVSVIGGAGTGTYAEIGHGGRNSSGSRTGDVEVTAGTGVLLQGGAGAEASAAIGHATANASPTLVNGSISVVAGGKLEMFGAGSGGGGGFAMIGHGGISSNGAKGDADDVIHVEATGDITLQGGVGGNTFVQIGNGGLNTTGNYLTKRIEVVSQNGDLTMIGGSNAGDDDAYVQIGHGSGQNTSTADSEILVDVRNGTVTVTAGAGNAGGTTTANCAQIGHGGHETLGAQSSQSIVLADAITLNGGTRDESYAQIGHGGFEDDTNPDGALSGDILINFDPTTGTVVGGGGDIVLTANAGSSRYAQIGHGGANRIADISGDIVVGRAANLTMNSGTGGSGAYTQIGHGGRLSGGSLAAGSDISVDVTGAITLAGGTATSAYSQIGHGGQDSSLPGLDGTITINAAAGSGTGTISVRGGSGTDAYAQIGNGGNRTTAAAATTQSGDIKILHSSGVNVLAGTGADARAQIGHGGDENYGDSSGSILVNALGGVVVVSGGGNTDAYAHIGHGGHAGVGNHGVTTDVIQVIADSLDFNGGTGSDSYAMLGNGGRNANGAMAGAIYVNYDSVGGTVSGGTGTITLDGGTGANSNAQIGHGGSGRSGNLDGGIRIGRAADLILTASSGGEAYAQVGHGGSATLSGTVTHADITIDVTGGIDLNAGTNTWNYAQIGHGGANTNALIVDAADILINDAAWAGTGDVTLDGNGSNAYAQIGHGGSRSDATPDFGNKSGDVTVSRSANITMTGGSGGDAYAIIGHGGEGGTGTGATGIFGGDIAVTTAGTLTMTGASSDSFAQIGHGGETSREDISGSITVTVGADLDMNGGTASEAYAQIGHGGSFFIGNISDAAVGVFVAGDISMDGGSTTNTNAQIGHGGVSSVGDISRSAVEVSAGGALTLFGAADGNTYAQVGHGGSGYLGTIADSTITVDAVGAIDLTAGKDQAYSQIGHGGYNTMTVNVSGSDILINTKAGSGMGDISLVGMETNAHAQIGHGGSRSDGNANFGQLSGDITIGQAANLNLTAGIETDGYAQIGHGGEGGNGTGVTGGYVGDIDVTIAGAVSLQGGSSLDTYVQIGHGGDNSQATASGSISVTAGGVVTMNAGSGEDSYAQIGQGGHGNARALGLAGDLIVVFGAALDLNGGSGNRTYVQIGNGGANATGGSTVTEIHVNASTGAITLDSGTGTGTYALIGGGGIGATGAQVGDICVHAATLISLNAATGVTDGAFSQIGHGGVGAAGNHQGDITVVSGVTGTGAISLTGGAAGTNRYAQIGHGGVNASGNLAGDIYLVSNNGGDLDLTGGAGSNAYAMIGHGDGAGTTTGTRKGGMHYFVGGDATVTNGAGTGSSGYLIHRTANAGGLAGAGNYLGGDGFQYVVNGTTSAPAAAFEGIGTMIASNAGTGPVTVAISGDVDIVVNGPSVSVDSANDFTIATGGDLTMLMGYQNLGAGNVTLIAGWDGSGADAGTVDLSVVCDPVITVGSFATALANCAAIGKNNGTITLGSVAQAQGIAIGSRLGQTGLAAAGLVMLGSDSTADGYTQFGYRPTAGSQGATGDIYVHLKSGGLQADAGDANGAYVQIGHGGKDAAANTHNAAIEIEFCEAGDIVFNGGTGLASYAQIGHLGYRSATGNTATATGDITVTGFRNLDLNAGRGSGAYVQVGHGGVEGDANKSGNITLTGATATADQGALTLDGSANGGSSDSYVQIGHGGRNAGDTKTGNISISDVTDIGIAGGGGTRSYAQIGHGGSNSQNGAVGTVSVEGSGALTVQAGTGSEASAHLGHGGQSVSLSVVNQSIMATMGGAVSVIGGTGSSAYAEIGHGGRNSVGSRTGDISVTAGGDVLVQGGIGNEAFASVGHTSVNASPSVVNGSVSVFAGGKIDLLGANGGSSG